MNKKIYLGLLLLLTGCSYSAFNKTNVSYENYEKYEFAREGGVAVADRTFNNIEVNWISGDILIEQTKSLFSFYEEYSVELEDNEKMHYLMEGNKFTIQPSAVGKFDSDRLKKKLTICIPSNFEIENLSINSVTSKIVLNNLTLDEAKINSVSGSVIVQDNDINDLKVDSVSGEIILKNVSSRNSNLQTVSGDVSIDSCELNKINVETVSGNVELNNLIFKSCDIDTVSGKVQLYLDKNSGYKIMFDSVSGKIQDSLGFRHENTNYYYGDGSIIIDVKTVSGSLKINESK